MGTFGRPLTSQVNREFSIKQKQIQIMEQLELNDLVNRRYMRQILRLRVPGHTLKSQRGLYQGKVIRTGHSIPFSEKKNKRRFDPNVFKSTFYSNILNKTITCNATTEALRCIKKYGGFDNYILLTKPSKLQSIFGEYLRKIMIEKLNNPDLNWNSIKVFGTLPNLRTKLKKHEHQKKAIWFPKHLRHGDHTMEYIRGFNGMAKDELTMVY